MHDYSQAFSQILLTNTKLQNAKSAYSFTILTKQMSDYKLDFRIIR